MIALEQELQLKKKEFGKMFVFSFLGLLAFCIALIFYMKSVNYTPLVPLNGMIFAFISVSFVGYLVTKTEFDFWPFYRVLTFSFIAINFYFSLYLEQRTVVIYFIFIPLLLMVLVLTNFKTAILCSIAVLSACFFTSHMLPQLSEPLEIPKYVENKHYNTFFLQIQNYAFLSFSNYLSFLILYYYNEFNKIESRHQLLEQNSFNKSPRLEVSENKFSQIEDFSTEKATVLYEEIVTFFENKKPYQNPNFNMSELCKALDTNATYVYRSLNLMTQKSFRDLVNEYRIAQVLSEIDQEAHKKFTIEHIYMEAGFVQQSTFNRVFKKTTGQTPSQYIENMPNN